jgi:predicted nucleotidyltransferase
MPPFTRSVPVVTKRRRIPSSAIRRVVDEIVRRFSPLKIVLFGSYARGNPRPESDVDLLIVMRTRRENEQSLLIRQAIDCDFGLDLIVFRPETVRRRVRLGDFFLRDILKSGKVLHETAHG